eukprot:5953139-Alexandrium_andersonii.AAC.1
MILRPFSTRAMVLPLRLLMRLRNFLPAHVQRELDAGEDNAEPLHLRISGAISSNCKGTRRVLCGICLGGGSGLGGSRRGTVGQVSVVWSGYLVLRCGRRRRAQHVPR